MNKLELLTKELNEASRIYYTENRQIMSNKEWDAKYDELVSLEHKLGYSLPDSPTKNIGYRVVSHLEKVTHEVPALSLDKTKDREALAAWLNGRTGVLSWKMDGLTVVVTYLGGKLLRAVTRGNGVVGEDITHNAPVILGMPMTIPEKGKVIVRGEAVISYQDFEEINKSLPEGDTYQNPRNLASGSIRQFDPKKCAERHVHFKAFTFVNALDFNGSYDASLRLLKEWGFDPVEYRIVSPENVIKAVAQFEQQIEENPYPSDGLVLALDDLEYGESLGMTGKFPRNAIAFKWQDETAETVLRNVEWSASRTGLINPVAVFDTVQLEGTDVSRASLHNLRYMQDLQLGIGDTVSVYKANKIIPQLDENLTAGENPPVPVPTKCPVCGHDTKRRIGADGLTESLYCTNPDCAAKHIGMFERFVCRDGLNVVGLSTSKLEQLIDNGFIRNRSDLFSLSQYEGEIASFDGWGEKSAGKLMQAIAKARTTTFRQFFYCLGIPGCGHDVAKILEKEFGKKTGCSKTALLSNLIGTADILDTLSMDGIGDVRAKAMQDWFETNEAEYKKLLNLLTISDDLIQKKEISASLEGMTFVITGAVHIFKNRNALKEEIESRNGKVSGSVSSKTDYLISNEPSTSAKSVKAAKLGVPVITEEEFLEKFKTQEETL